MKYQMVFNCKRCGYETQRISGLKTHLSRKKVCEDKNFCGISTNNLLKELDKDTSDYKHECAICKKKYKSLSGLYNHKGKCTVVEDPMKMQIVIKNYENQLESLQNKLKELTSSTHINQNITQNIAQQNNIIINHLGGENTSYITPEFIAECIRKRLDGLIDYIDKKHFHPEHPENHNLRLENGALRMLEEPFFANDRNTRSKEPAGANFWTAVKSNETALEEKILSRVETAFKAFLNSRDASSLGEDYLCKFIQEIVLPLDWSMDMHELEEELDTEDEETLSAVKTKIFGKILDSIEKRYHALVSARV